MSRIYGAADFKALDKYDRINDRAFGSGKYNAFACRLHRAGHKEWAQRTWHKINVLLVRRHNALNIQLPAGPL